MPALGLETTRWGDGPHRALLIHGASSSAEVWWRLGPDLAALGFTATAPDLRGHGASPRDDDWSLTSYRDDVLALGGEWDLVLGHSLGGLVAVVAQVADAAFARSIVLEDPALRFRASPEFLDWLVQEFAVPVTVEAIAAVNPGWHQRDIESKVRSLHAVGPGAIRATFECFGDVDEFSALAELGVPTLLLGADPSLDAIVTPDDIAMASRVPGVEALTIHGASHSIHRDAYPAFWDAVCGFLRRHVV